MTEPAVVDGISISCRGPVRSVLLAYTGELEDLRSIQLDPASHTSNYLARIVLGQFHQLNPDYVQITERIQIIPQAVVIGDPALSLSKRPSHPGLKFLDLGGQWVRHTGLPFVFAIWLLARNSTDKKLVAEHLRSAKAHGLASVDRIASTTPIPSSPNRISVARFATILARRKSGDWSVFGSW